jgi:dephospho-CoA kinase
VLGVDPLEPSGAILTQNIKVFINGEIQTVIQDYIYNGTTKVVTINYDILTEGDIDRQKLGKIVFKDASKRKQLEAIVHPRVQEALAAKIRTLSPGDILIYEIPLLVESGAADRFDYIITVESDIENRLDRLFERGLDEDEAERRIAAQASPAQREAVADRVIINDGDRADLFAECARIWEAELNAPRQ